MRLKTQLYIDTSDNTIDEEAKYELVDFFDFESIEITETIKNIQEFDLVFLISLSYIIYYFVSKFKFYCVVY